MDHEFENQLDTVQRWRMGAEAIDIAAAGIIHAVPFIQSVKLKYETWNQGAKFSDA